MIDKQPKIVALCGKGGVGKTSLSALITRVLMENRSNRILAIDADPAIGLATSLGFKIGNSVDNIRNELIDRLKKRTAGDSSQITKQLDYDLLEAIEERENLAFLAIGRPEKEGCYCQVNAILRDLIASLSRNFDFVVIDGEAGIEQVNRRVMESVTHLLLVSDGSQKGINVAHTIAAVADKSIKHEAKGIFFNRVKQEELSLLTSKINLDLFGWLSEDDLLRQFDIEGKSLLEMGETQSMKAVRQCVDRLFSHQ
ncbi:AAA family ATPase [bacterium]|nr:AAA family ATPase [bacterium]